MNGNKSLRITKIKFETFEGSANKEINGQEHLKSANMDFGRVNKAKKVIVVRKVRESSKGMGEVEIKKVTFCAK